MSFLLRRLTLRRALNITRCLLEMRSGHSVLRSHPFYARVCVSNICNLACPGCLLSQGQAGKPESTRLMSFGTFAEAIADFLPFLLKVNLYDEGEPLLNPELFRMTRHLADHNVASCVSSNLAMTLTDGVLGQLLDAKLTHLIVAVDGATQSSYCRYRHGGSLVAVTENLQRLLARKRKMRQREPFVELQFIEFPHNRHEHSEVARLAGNLGVDRFTVIRGSSPDGWNGTDFHGSEAERRRRGCYQLWVAAHISAAGSLGTCDYGEDHGMPNLGAAKNYCRSGLRNHPYLVSLRSSFRDAGPPLNDTCRTCSLFRTV